MVQVLLISLALHDTHRDRHRAAPSRNTFTLVFFPLLDAYVCVWGVEIKEAFFLINSLGNSDVTVQVKTFSLNQSTT